MNVPGRAVTSLFRNSMKNQFYLNKSYSILCSNYQNHELGKVKIMRTNESILQSRNFSLESTRDSYLSFINTVSESDLAAFTKNTLISIHDTTGLPWWASIFVGAACLRFGLTFPIAVYQEHLIARLKHCHIELKKLHEPMMKETKMAIKQFNWTLRKARIVYNRSMKKQWKILVEKHNCHPGKTAILTLMQFPLWLVLSVTLRNMTLNMSLDSVESQLLAMQFSEGGALWFKNLLVPDSYFILPIAVAMISLINIEVNSLRRVNSNKYIINFFRFIAVISIPISVIMPSGVTFYWASSSALALIQHLTLMSPKVRKFFKIPVMPDDKLNPYRSIAEAFKDKWHLRRK